MKPIGDTIAEMMQAANAGEFCGTDFPPLSFRRDPRDDACRKLLAALAHQLPRAGVFWEYADAIAARMTRKRVRQVEDLPPRQMAAVLQAVIKKIPPSLRQKPKGTKP